MAEVNYGELLKSVRELRKLSDSAIKAVMQANMPEFFDLLESYIRLKKQIKTDILDCEFAKISDPWDREALSKISLGDPFYKVDQLIEAIESKDDEPLNLDGLDDDEINELSDTLYSWISHYEYIEALYDIGSLIVGVSVPQQLITYVSEARQCYAFQQYNAVYAMCRTIIETAARHNCERKRKLPKPNNQNDYDSPGPCNLIRMASKGELRTKLLELYDNTSKLLHGHKTVHARDARKAFKETIRSVQGLYE